MSQIEFSVYADPALPLNAPNFPKVDESRFVAHVKEAIALARQRFEMVKSTPEAPDFANTITALHHISTELGQVLSVFYTLFGAESTDTIQAMAQEIGPLTAEFSNDIDLDPVIFSRVKDLWDRRDTLALSDAEIAVLKDTYEGFVRNGALLSDTDKETLRALDAELSRLSPKFADNARQSANAFEMVIEDKNALSGLPETALTAAKEAAEAKGNNSGWCFTLDYPSYIPFMTYADNRELREKLWRAFSARGLGEPFDNREIAKKVAQIRLERANLLGSKTYAEYALDRRMAQNIGNVHAFIDRLEKGVRPAAEDDLQKLQDFAKGNGFKGKLKPWDIAYWSEKMKKAHFDFDEEALRPYFPLDQVINGVFTHAEKLFGVKVTPIEKIPTYHEDVSTYEVRDFDGTMRGLLYADFHPREGKRQGAWQSSIRDRDTDAQGEIELPLISIVMNFTKPTKDKPSLLTFDEVSTLFHEFGHALHSLLTDIDLGQISGTSVYWDFVELPSQIMENWLTEPETLNLFARHYETGEPIPTEMIDKLRKSENFMKGWFYLRQLSLCQLDLAWHTQDDVAAIENADVIAYERAAVDPYVLIDYEGGCTSTSFTHIFAGGYAAGYYSYLWAEILDADAFEMFKENGLYDEATGQKFRNEILAKGGLYHPAELYRNFRGRDANPDALLKRSGLLKEHDKAA